MESRDLKSSQAVAPWPSAESTATRPSVREADIGSSSIGRCSDDELGGSDRRGGRAGGSQEGPEGERTSARQRGHMCDPLSHSWFGDASQGQTWAVPSFAGRKRDAPRDSPCAGSAGKGASSSGRVVGTESKCGKASGQVCDLKARVRRRQGLTSSRQIAHLPSASPSVPPRPTNTSL